MLPSPREAARQGSPLAPTGIFVTGYIVIWSLFSLGGDHSSVGPGPHGSPIADDDERQPDSRRTPVADRRNLSADTRQRRMPAARPLSRALRFLALEIGRSERLSDGHRARCLLPWLLLDLDIRALIRYAPWLDHASVETTNGYVEIDLEMKRKNALVKSCEKLLPKEGTAHPGNATTTSFLGCRAVAAGHITIQPT
jgi:hypothetical protein